MRVLGLLAVHTSRKCPLRVSPCAIRPGSLTDPVPVDLLFSCGAPLPGLRAIGFARTSIVCRDAASPRGTPIIRIRSGFVRDRIIKAGRRATNGLG